MSNSLSTHCVQYFPFTRKALSAIGNECLFIIETLGHAAQYTWEIVCFICSGEFNFKHFKDQLGFIGIDTLGIALVMNIFSGMVIALQMAHTMVQQGGGNFVGALMSLAIIRELGPIMTAFSVIAMAASAYTAEISTMKITNQVSALEVLHVNPVRYLLMPRVLAGITALPLMCVITCTAGLLGGLFVSHVMADLSIDQYIDSVRIQTTLKDVLMMLVKSGIFGFIIFIVSTTIGLHTKGGSKEVGQSTTRAVVWSFIMIAIVDYVMTYLVYGSHA